MECSILNIYGPAQSPQRRPFLENFMSSPFSAPVEEDVPQFLLGDLNLSLQKLEDHCDDPRFLYWHQWLSEHFDNCFPEGHPTFHRSSHTSTIDYIFCSTSAHPRVANCQQVYLPASWTDHQMLHLDLVSDREDIGPGFWRFNTSLLKNDIFVELLTDVIDTFFSSIDSLSSRSTQDIWESLKRALRDTCESFANGYKKQSQTKIQQLQRELQTLLSSTNSPDILRQQVVIQQLNDTLEKEMENELEKVLLWSATRWHEKGERNTRYFHKVIKTRQSQQTIQTLRCSVTGNLLETTPDILKEAHRFYSHLYTPEDIDMTAVESLLDSIPGNVTLSDQDSNSLETNPTQVVDHAPNQKSPGLDGLPFEVYKYLFNHFPKATLLFLDVLADALNGTIPWSWKQTRMVLLYKKNDPTLLSNWRPLSLINSDAKIFTKILANRLNTVLPRLINPYQTGFMPHRLISDNGWVNITLMENYRKSRDPRASSAVSVMLDQEKAYDRVHPQYLAAVLSRFGFPTRLINALSLLFFSTEISVSINGFLGQSLVQGRGLRQGDPLSPLLFNLAFEPFLRTLLISPLTGVTMLPMQTQFYSMAKPPLIRNPDTGEDDCPIQWHAPPTFKILSYADDLEVFLSSPAEWSILQELLSLYASASNAKVNINKTDIVSLSGESYPAWVEIASAAGIDYHTKDSSTIVRYLGYPLYSSPKQLKSYLGRIKTVIQIKCNQLKDRGLSVRGFSLLANSQVLSKIWHLLRVVPVPKSWLSKIRSVVRKFALPFRPAPSWRSICMHKHLGGLGVIDIHQQHLALQFIFIQRILCPKCSADFVTPLIGYSIFLCTGHHSFLPWLQFSREFLPLFNKLSTMSILTRLLTELPALPGHHQWPGRWYADTPLRCSLFSTVSPSNPDFYDLSQIPLGYTVANAVSWSYFYNQYTNFIRVDLPISGPTGTILQKLKRENPPIEWLPLLKKFMPRDFNRDVPPSDYSFNGRSQVTSSALTPDASRWVPSCNHWLFKIGYNKVLPFHKLNPGVESSTQLLNS